MSSDTTKLFTEPRYMWMPGNIYNSLLVRDGRPPQPHAPTPAEWAVVGTCALAILAVCWFCIVRPILKEGG